MYWDQQEQWDAVLTCFFLDTAKNVLLYIRTIARLLPPNGVWANLGPLLYHFSEMPNEISIELSWEEIRQGIKAFYVLATFRRTFVFLLKGQNGFCFHKFSDAPVLQW